MAFYRTALRTFATATAAIALMASASPALADWVRYESPHFELYSSGSAREATDMLIELEKFDTILRIFMGQTGETEVYRKLPIYLVSNSGMRTISPGIQSEVAGFYTSSNEDIFAVALRGDSFRTLKHEYAHHFMLANFSSAYPAWFIEGFAEYYAATVFDRNVTKVGVPDPARAQALSYFSWMSMSEFLSNRPLVKARNWESYYPLSWLLAHWFLGDETRRAQLHAYLTDIASGTSSVEAMQKATGLDMIQLRATLRRYMNGRIPYMGVQTTYADPQITSTPLPPSADDLLLLGQQLKLGTNEEKRAETLIEVRRKAARYPDDTLALLVLAHAELHNGRSPEEAIKVLDRLLAIDPNHVEGLQYMARAKQEQAQKVFEEDRVAEANSLRREAQTYLGRAYQLDDANFITMLLLAENRMGEASYPSENDIAVLEIAYALAPQLGEVRFNLASAYLDIGKNAEAIAVIEPLVNNPHGENASARALLLRAKGQSEAEAEAEEEALRLKGQEEGEDTAASPSS